MRWYMKPSNRNFISLYRKSIAVSLLLTFGIFVGHYFLPDKRLNLLPADQATIALFSFTDSQTGSSARWLDDTHSDWICTFKPHHTYGCGWEIRTSAELDKGIDLSEFSALEIKMQYSGPARRIRLFIRNFNPAYTDPTDPTTFKSMTMSFPVEETAGLVHVNLKEFNVADWWLLTRKQRQQWPLPEFNAVTHIGVDIAEQGTHQLRIDSLVLTGKWLKTEQVLMVVLSFWMAVFLLEGTLRFYLLYRKAQQNRQAIQALKEKQRTLEEENQHLENLADTDPLTGIYNRAGLRNRVDALMQRERNLAGVGILLLDLDHFKELNDRYGHDMGDKVLKAFTSILVVNLRDDDIFARLGGEEFVVVCRRQPVEGVRAFAEKLCRLAAQCSFNGEDHLHISVSIGVALVNVDEDFASALERADAALYQAKQNGRNRVEFDTTP